MDRDVRQPPDLRHFMEPPPFNDARARHWLHEGQRRVGRFRRRRLVLALVLGAVGTAAAALWPRIETPVRATRLTFPADPLTRESQGPWPGIPAFAHPAASLPLIKAFPSDALVDAIGIHVRLWYPAYGGTNARLVQPRLGELGVRHLYDVSQSNLGWLRELGMAGFKVHLLLRETVDPATVAGGFAPGSLASVQTDWQFGRSWRDGQFDENWAAKVRLLAQANHARVRGLPSMSRVLVVGPSVRAPYESPLVGDLAAFADVGSLSFWPGPGPPEAGELNRELALQREVFPGRALTITQTGYNTAPTPISRVSETLQARYLLRQHLLAFESGVTRSFANHLLDFSSESGSADAGLGLLRRDGSAKPSFFALKRLIAALTDRGPKAETHPLALMVDCDEPDLRQLLFQRRDGAYVLAVWLARVSQDESVRRPATLRLARPALGLRVLDLHSSDLFIVEGDGSSLKFEVSDGVSLLEIRMSQ